MKLSSIETPVSSLSGIGPTMAKTLAKVGIFTVADLLSYWPRDFEDRTKKIISEMKNRNNSSTNKPKSPEVRGQEQKVMENEQQVANDEKSKFINADGEVL